MQLTLAIRPCQRGTPTANSLHAYARGEFAVTAYSISLVAIARKSEKTTVKSKPAKKQNYREFEVDKLLTVN